MPCSEYRTNNNEWNSNNQMEILIFCANCERQTKIGIEIRTRMKVEICKIKMNYSYCALVPSTQIPALVCWIDESLFDVLPYAEILNAYNIVKWGRILRFD